MTEIALEKRYSNARQALEALQSGQMRPSSAAKIPTLRKFPKPSGTYIKLDKSAEQQTIIIPAPGLRILARTGCLGIVFFLSLGLILFFVLVAVLKVILAGSSLFASVAGLILLMAILIPLCVLFSGVFGERTHIYFKQKYFEIEREFLRLKYGKYKVDFTRIFGVFLHKEGIAYHVSVRLCDGNYDLGGALGENESIWLAQEIQDWLNAR